MNKNASLINSVNMIKMQSYFLFWKLFLSIISAGEETDEACVRKNKMWVKIPYSLMMKN